MVASLLIFNALILFENWISVLDSFFWYYSLKKHEYKEPVNYNNLKEQLKYNIKGDINNRN